MSNVADVSSLDDCHGLCEMEPLCAFAIYERDGEKGCFLKSSTKDGGYAKPGLSMIPRICDCMERNVKYNGPGLILEGVEGIFKCQGICLGTAGCQAFSYDMTNKQCFAVSKIEGKEPKNGTVSGAHDVCL